MNKLLEQVSDLVFETSLDMQNDGYFFWFSRARGGVSNIPSRQRLTKEQLPRTLYNLTKVVAELNKRRPIVLIDKYNAPPSYAVLNGYFPDVFPSAHLGTVWFLILNL